ncbi:MAG: hypothetical protein PVF27_08670 [Gemmatimonadales bacterium]|jgi:hypothetical protein
MLKRTRDFVRRLREERRRLGWRGLMRKRGWRLVAMVVLFYLVRDLILYVVIPLALVLGIAR